MEKVDPMSNFSVPGLDRENMCMKTLLWICWKSTLATKERAYLLAAPNNRHNYWNGDGCNPHDNQTGYNRCGHILPLNPAQNRPD